MTKQTKWLCAQQRFWSAWASAQSDESLSCVLNAWSESSLGTHAILLVLSWGGSKVYFFIACKIIKLAGCHVFEASTAYYRKFPKYSDTQNICCNHSKIWTMWLYHRVMGPNDADGMANSVDPDQTAPLGAVWSGSALFAQAYLSENLGSLRYLVLHSRKFEPTWATSEKATSASG